jgi:predicted HicB family RNase H-like nuclease
VFHGKILGITDPVSFEASSVKGLKTAFKESVEDYLELCKEIGKLPQLQ